MRRLSALILFAVLAAPAFGFPRRELALWLQSVTVTQRADGAVGVGDCYDERTEEGRAFADGLGARLREATAPLRVEFLTRLGAQSLPPAALTRAYRTLVIREGVTRGGKGEPMPAATCTTGYCDCTACPAEAESCGCRTSRYEDGMLVDCDGPRKSCNETVYGPKKLATQNDLAAEALRR